jgi:hypothetical protein
MNKYIYALLIALLVFFDIKAQNTLFSVNNNNITIWNGESFQPFFVKGVNLGISRPGTYPGEMDATAEQYRQWFAEIRDAGFNSIRIYTLHRPQFYDELLAYNLANPQHPLFFFQGIWLNEELDGYKKDLYFLTDTFKVEIRENIDCVHGKNTIPQRFGKAYGEYNSDVSRWNIGYIIGREVYPEEVLITNKNNPTKNSFLGKAFGIQNASPTEAWFTSQLDYLVNYERTTYNIQRPVSMSSWPTLDPLHHPSEPNRDEDTASIDLSKIRYIDAPSGLFISYHAYPYYPDFIGASPKYNGTFDKYGPNSYLAYLIDLKTHYKNYPLIIAEFGVPSSWGVAHYSSSGMNHGGYDEIEQGEINLRLLQTIFDANLGGGIHFSWIDEWFKRTWITDPVDSEDRVLWHNVTAAEQNFGLKNYKTKRDWQLWKDFGTDDLIKNLFVRQNYDFLEFKIDLNNSFDILDELWLAIDTYDAALGEVRLPNGQIINHGAEFVLHITRHSARLFVTEAYDIYALWHRETTEEQKHQSIASNGAPWKIVRWKNSIGPLDIQYIGDLKVNISVQPPSSKDAVLIDEKSLSIRLPWTLINFTDPSKMRVFHDDKATRAYESQSSDGVAVSIAYKNKLFASDNRFTWPLWDQVLLSDVDEVFKPSYWSMYYNLTKFNTPAIAMPDTYTKSDDAAAFRVNVENGVIQNDFDMDGFALIAVLTDAPNNGFVELSADGSFVYIPKVGFSGIDNFKYALFDGQTLSKPTNVIIYIEKENRKNSAANDKLFRIYPNPANEFVNIEAKVNIRSLKLLDNSGKILNNYAINSKKKTVDVSALNAGFYFFVVEIAGHFFSEKLLIQKLN